MNVIEELIPRTADQEFAIFVYSDNGVLLNLDPATQILILVYGADKTVIGKFAKAMGGDYTESVNDDLGEFGELRIKIKGSTMTATAALQKYYYECRVLFPDGTYPDLKDDKIMTNNYLFTLVESMTQGTSWV